MPWPAIADALRRQVMVEAQYRHGDKLLAFFSAIPLPDWRATARDLTVYRVIAGRAAGGGVDGSGERAPEDTGVQCLLKFLFVAPDYHMKR